MDCPELIDDDYICDSCLFEDHIAEKLVEIECAIQLALDTKPLRDHPHRAAHGYLCVALEDLDELWNDLIDDDETF